MARNERASDGAPLGGPMSRPRATDPVADALVRREEEFRRFLVSVATPAFEELRSSFRAEGCEAKVSVTTRPGRPAEATIVVTREGAPEFFCTVRGAITAERATVPKRRPVPIIHAPGARVHEEEAPLLGVSEPASDATTITRAEVVASIRSDYWALRHAQGRG